MAEEHPNARLIRDFHAAQKRFYAGGGQEPVRAMLAADVTWHVPGRSPLAGDHRGRDEVLLYFAGRRKLARAQFRIAVHRVLADDERTVILAGGRLQRDGKARTWDIVGVFRIAAGRIAECWVLPYDQHAFDDIWSSAAGAIQAETVLTEAVDAYRAALGERLVAAYALGSLAHGGFSPLVSDIDLGLIVGDPPRSGDAELIGAVADAEKAKDSGLCERLSVFWGTPSTLRGEREGGRFPPLDRLDLIENGRLLAGTDGRTDLPRPSAEALVVRGAEFALDYLAGARSVGRPPTDGLGSMRPAEEDAVQEIRSPELLLTRGPRRTTKLVLFPIRFLFTAATGQVGTHDAAVAHHLAGRGAPGTNLVTAALLWRTVPPADHEAAAELLREQLVPLYVYYIDDHIARLDSLGQADLARAFEEWRERIVH